MSENTASFDWSELAELREALRRLPEELGGEAAHIVEATTNAAAADIKAAYPRVTGNLSDGLAWGVEANRFGAAGYVRNTAPHAYLFENGSEARHYITKRGARHLTGRMPPAHAFIPVMQRRRRAMYGQLKALMERHGLMVSGDA